MKTNIVTRFAPSPTGPFHIGSARTALFCYLFAKQNNGQLIVRLEDTDKERSEEKYEKDIKESLAWLGLDYEKENYFRQSERTDIYKTQLEKLIADDKAYWSKEEVKEEGQRDQVIRFRNSSEKVAFRDLIHGEIIMDTSDLGDFVIAKDLETPIFHFTNVVDDVEMGITHVIRGDDHISNTPRQILIMRAIGAISIPIYAHMPLILDNDRAKLSKRKHGEMVWIKTYREQGYLPEAMINFLAQLGWSPQAESHGQQGTNQEILTREELIRMFDLSKLQKGGAVFNIEKLNWLNHEYIKNLPPNRIEEELNQRWPDCPKNLRQRLVPIVTERINKFADITEAIQTGEWDYFVVQPEYKKELLKTTDYLKQTREILESISENDFSDQTKLKNTLWDFATEKGRGQVLWPLRVALTGREKSPDPFVVASVIGKEETLKRINHALDL